MGGQRHAADYALEAFLQPAKLQTLMKSDFPEGMFDVIRAAAGHQETLNFLSGQTGAESKNIQQACDFLLQHVLLSNQDNPMRMLGLNAGFDVRTVNNHRRWLLRWLHPDVNSNSWQSNLFDRVIKASQMLDQQVQTVDLETPKQNLSGASTSISKPAIVRGRRSGARFSRRRRLDWADFFRRVAVRVVGLAVVIVVVYLLVALAVAQDATRLYQAGVLDSGPQQVLEL